MLRAILYAATRSGHEAEDLLQQVGTVLWQKFETYDSSRPFAAWAVGFAQMEIRKWREKASRRGRLVSISDEAVAALADACVRAVDEPAAGPADDADTLRDCVERLTPAAKQAIRMKYTDGQSIAQIAAVQGREIGAVEMALVRARRALRQCIETKWQASGDGRKARHLG